jgi:diguanylate cyclase (GGDEF)-like protein
MASGFADIFEIADSLRLSAQERAVLQRHAAALEALADSLTDKFWNWLQTHGSVANYLQKIAPDQLNSAKSVMSSHYRALLASDYDNKLADALITLGWLPHRIGLSGQWIVDSYNVFAVFLDQAIETIAPEDRELLRRAMQRRLQLVRGCVQFGYRNAQEETARMRDALYEAIRFSNQLLAHHTNAMLLLDGVAKTLIHHLKAPLLAIGFVNPDSRQIQIRAATGPAKAYLDGLQMSALQDLPTGRGPAGRAITSGKVVQVDYFADDPEFAPWRSQAEKFGLVGSITAPFKTRRGQQGFLCMYRSMENTFPEGAAPLMERLAADIGTALDRIHTQRELRRMHDYEEALDAVNEMLLKNPAPPAIYRLLVDMIIQHTNAPAAYVRRIDVPGQRAEIVSYAGKAAEEMVARQLIIDLQGPMGNGIAGKVYRNGKAIVTPDITTIPDFAPWTELFKTLRLRGAAGFPIGEKGKPPEAVLFVASRQGSYFSRSIVKLLSRLAGNASLALASHRQRERLEHLSIHDSLTNLPNRAYFERATTEALGRADRNHQHLAIGILDLDGFKEINDTLGHAAGDDLLRVISQRLSTAMRKGDVVARIGGDEFGLLLSMADGGDIGPLAARLLEVLDEPVNWAGQKITVNARMGFTVYPLDASDRETLLRHADAVLYSAKEGDARVEVFQSSVAEKVEQRFRTRQMFPTAVTNGSIRFFLQPQANMRHGTLDGLEMLVRWREGDKWLSPAAFMPVIEHDPALIRLLGELVIRQSVLLRQRLLHEGLDLRISVNIGSRHLLHPSFLDDLDAALAQCDNPSFLTVEITEVTALTDMPLAIARLEAIHTRRISTSLDDFGTGHASMLYAASLPVSELKLGQEFVRGLLVKNAHASVTISALQFASLSGTQLIAEGVEKQEQLDFWLRLGGEKIQGYLLARPMEEDQLIAWAKDWTLSPRRSPACFERDDLMLLTRHVSVIERLARLRAMRAAGDSDPLPIVVPPIEKCPTGHWIEHRRPRFGHLPEFVAMDTVHRQRHAVLAPHPQDSEIELLEQWGQALHNVIIAIDRELVG